MKGMRDIESVNKKKSITRFQAALFQIYTPVRLSIPRIPGIRTIFFIIYIKGRLVTSTMSPGENQRELSDRFSDLKSGSFRGVATW